MAFGYGLDKIFTEPTFNERGIGSVVVAFHGEVLPVAQGSDDVHSLKLPTSFEILDFLSPRGASVFAHEAGVNHAFVDVHALFRRNPGKLR